MSDVQINRETVEQLTSRVSTLQQENATLKKKLQEATTIITGIVKYENVDNMIEVMELAQDFISSCNVVPVEPKSEEVVKSCFTCKLKCGIMAQAANCEANCPRHEPKKVVTKELNTDDQNTGQEER